MIVRRPQRRGKPRDAEPHWLDLESGNHQQVDAVAHCIWVMAAHAHELIKYLSEVDGGDRDRGTAPENLVNGWPGWLSNQLGDERRRVEDSQGLRLR